MRKAVKKVLFIVPHQDDELLVGGPLLISLTRDPNYETFLFITTNGDYVPSFSPIRKKESVKAMTAMGMKKENIFFGGIGDTWPKTHIYNAKDNEKVASSTGQIYTRKQFKDAIRNTILNVDPNVLVAVDMDFHPDHRALSLLTDEVICELLKQNKCTNMLVLKKFAYFALYFGQADFFHYPHKPQISDTNKTFNPYFDWKERLIYQVQKDCNTLLLHTNYLFKLSRYYKNQFFWAHAERFVNSDTVYFQRNTNNKALLGQITVSSGDAKFLNDFKIIDTSNVKEDDTYQKLCWRPDKEDKNKKITINLSKEEKIKTLKLYFTNRIKGTISIQLDNAEPITKKINTKDDFKIETINLNSKAKTIALNLSSLQGNLGLSEIEVLDKQQQAPFKEYLKSQDGTEPNKEKENLKLLKNLILKIEQALFALEKIFCFRLVRKIRYLLHHVV